MVTFKFNRQLLYGRSKLGSGVITSCIYMRNWKLSTDHPPGRTLGTEFMGFCILMIKVNKKAKSYRFSFF